MAKVKKEQHLTVTQDAPELTQEFVTINTEQPLTVTKEVSELTEDFVTINTDVDVVKEMPEKKELSSEEKIMKYVEDAHSNSVDLVPVIKSLYPLPTMSMPAEYLLQNESKKIKFLLECMVKGGKLTLLDDTYLFLGKPYWQDGSAKTSHHTINSLKIYAVKQG